MRARLTFGFTLTSLFLVILACTGITIYLFVSTSRDVDGMLARTRNNIREAQQGDPGTAGLRRWLSEHSISIDSDDMAAVMVDGSGRILLQTQPSIPTWPRSSGDGWRVISIQSDDATLVVGYPWTKRQTAIIEQCALLFILGIFAVSVTSAAAWAIVGHTLSPIQKLSRQARASSTDNLRPVLAAVTRDAEIVELVDTLNDLLNRLAQTAAARGRFYAAASHELRNPLQALTGHLELALARPRDAEVYRHVVQEAHAQTLRLTTLTKDLLLLNRLETSVEGAAEAVDVVEICERMLRLFAPTIRSRQLKLSSALPDQAYVLAPSMHVEVLVRNLIENAVKYASEGGSVSVSVESLDTTVVFQVFNSFPFDAQLDANQLFEPFFRPDASRNSQTGGNGLGLAICKSITGLNQWPFEWTHRSSGVFATVTLPPASNDGADGTMTRAERR